VEGEEWHVRGRLTRASAWSCIRDLVRSIRDLLVLMYKEPSKEYKRPISALSFVIPKS
jgi:hypothetical protein